MKNNPYAQQLLDKWYAFRQSQHKDYVNDIKLSFDDYPIADAVNIWFERMPESIDPIIDLYDYIFLCNNGEALTVSSSQLPKLLERSNAYLFADVTLSEDHQLKNKIITYDYDSALCNDYWTRSFYPQFYENCSHKKLAKQTVMQFVNGANRTWRKYVVDLLSTQIPTIPIRDTYKKFLSPTNNCQWESVQDMKFREHANRLYQDQIVFSHDIDPYYSKAPVIGVNGKFGTIPPGYFIIEDYWWSNCVIYPEATWQNNQLILTEKSYKCFYTRTFPFIIGGSKVNQLCNSRGFYTAWNLLPSELQTYDAIENHIERYEQMIHAIKWLHDHPDVFVNQMARGMLESNQVNCLTNHFDYLIVKEFDSFMNRLLQ